MEYSSIPGTTLTEAFTEIFNSSVDTPQSDVMVGLYVAYVTIMVVSLVANSLLIFIVFHRPTMNTSTNLQFANMAIADVIATVFSMPLWSYFICFARDWLNGLAGDVLCSIAASTSILTSLASVQTLMAVSVERFIAVFFPLKRMTVTRNTKPITAVIWIISLMFGVPSAFMYAVRQEQGRLQCLNKLQLRNIDLRKIYYVCIFVLMFGLPVAVMSVMYIMIGTRLWFRRIPGQQSYAGQRAVHLGRWKVLRMLIILVAAFVGCWLPVHIEWFREIFKSTARKEELAIVLAHANSALNPCLLFIFNGRFRYELGILIKSCYGVNIRQNNPFEFLSSLKWSSRQRVNVGHSSHRVPSLRLRAVQSGTYTITEIPKGFSPAVTLLNMATLQENAQQSIRAVYATEDEQNWD